MSDQSEVHTEQGFPRTSTSILLFIIMMGLLGTQILEGRGSAVMNFLVGAGTAAVLVCLVAAVYWVTFRRLFR